MELRGGEFVIDQLDDVEDTKGNNGEPGSLSITNLRMIYQSKRSKRVNVSVGYKTIISMTIRTANSKLRGPSQALYVLCKFGSTRYEFVFTHLVPNSPRLFTTIQTVHRAYESSKLFREVRLRAALIRDHQLIMLPHETLFSKLSGVWNLSSDQGNLGRFFITNVRVVWHAQLAENFNVSVPYMQMKSVRLRESTRFGLALVIETSEESGGFVLGFRVDPVEALVAVTQEIENLFAMFAETPIFGVDFSVESVAVPIEARTVALVEESDQVLADDRSSALACYYADPEKNADRPAVFSPDLGLAVEDLREGTTIAQLWSLLPQQ